MAGSASAPRVRFVGDAELQGVSCLTCCPGLRSIKIEISSEHLMVSRSTRPCSLACPVTDAAGAAPPLWQDLVVAGMSMRQVRTMCISDHDGPALLTCHVRGWSVQAWASGCLKDAEEVTIFTTVAKVGQTGSGLNRPCHN